MKMITILSSVILLTLLGGCQQPIQNVAIPSPQDQAAYQPQPYPKPLPANAYGPSVTGNPYGTHVALPDEADYVRAYQAQRDPRMMVEVLLGQGAVTAGAFHLGNEDFDAIQISIIEYLNANGQVDIQDPSMAQKILDRESFLRLQNGDPKVLPLLKHQLKTDILIEIQAAPTQQASYGNAVRLLAQAVSTTDARVLAATYVDMPLPASKTNINVYTGYLADKIMQKLAAIWGGGTQAYNPMIVRIYNAASLDDVLAIEHLIRKVPGVRLVIDRGMTGSAATAYGRLAIEYNGTPGDFYSALKQELAVSTGLKAVDLQNNTIDLQITGPMILRTTSIKTTTHIETQTTRTQVQTVKETPIQPAPQ
ncbi:MAG: hypothetical protein M0Z50_09020 [Planctomycetia bacterium]|nr:hypothetical protein [Planctomycetia bacterium]